MIPDAFAAQAWLLSVSVSALALVRGVLWLRGSPSSSNGTRDAVTRTLALVERQQGDLEKAIAVLIDQQGVLREAHTTRQGQQAVLGGISEQMERVADSLDRTVERLTVITADVEHTQIEMAAHRAASEAAVGQVAEIHAHLMRGRKR